MTEKVKRVLLVGNPNVGKSMTFNKLTGAYVVVSNYPGTTVTIDEGKFTHKGIAFEVTDSPGMYSLSSISEEERISKLLVLTDSYDTIVHVLDAKNMERSLDLTLQLKEAGKDVILAVNMMDELESKGCSIDKEGLESALNIPVILTSASENKGIDELKEVLTQDREVISKNVQYESKVEHVLLDLEYLLKSNYPISKRTISVMLLEEDEDVTKLVEEREKNYKTIEGFIKKSLTNFQEPIEYLNRLNLHNLSIKYKEKYTIKIDNGSHEDKSGKISLNEKISRKLIDPIWGIPILFIVLYFGLYQFVGVFGAGYLVDFIETTIFGQYIVPPITNLVNTYITSIPLKNLFIGPYGIITLGLNYAIAIILPIVGTYFFMFAILEDSGYLPRLALLLDSLFKRIGLNGRAIIPIVLGVGCGSMATIVTRTLETKRERTIATILLALTIPCSAQLGIIFAILSGYPVAIWIWALVIISIFLITGYASSKLLPGEKSDFYMELPPIRVPKLENILTKTYSRMVWYFKELLPIFLAVSVIIWALDLIGVFPFIIDLMIPVVNGIGLPNVASESFILGFFRRDYGAAGLYSARTALTGVQLLVATVTLTLFLPCVAQFMIMIKERGLKTALGIGLLSLTIAFTTGFILNLIFTSLGIVL